MDAQAFAYWLRGFTETAPCAQPSAQQWQIINDHLDLVFNKVTPDRWSKGGPQNSPTMSLSGFGQMFQQEAQENRDKVFVTISCVPIYDPTAYYSFYPYRQSVNDKGVTGTMEMNPRTRTFLDEFGVRSVDDKVYVVIDNKLGPTKPTYADKMHGSSDHLTMVSRIGPGIINVGVGSPLTC